MKKFLGLSGLRIVIDEVKKLISSIDNKYNSHISNKSNPHNVTKEQIGLNNVENKSSATIRGELTKDNIVDSLGYTPVQTQYIHPSTHSASIITQDATHRFVTDTEKNKWNNKAEASHNHDNVIDTNGRSLITFAYSEEDFENPSYFAVWNGFQLRALNKSKMCMGKATVMAWQRYLNAHN